MPRRAGQNFSGGPYAPEGAARLDEMRAVPCLALVTRFVPQHLVDRDVRGMAPPHRQGPRDARNHHGRAAGRAATETTDALLVWISVDDGGIELEIVALDLDEAVVVIHVMPTVLRR